MGVGREGAAALADDMSGVGRNGPAAKNAKSSSLSNGGCLSEGTACGAADFCAACERTIVAATLKTDKQTTTTAARRRGACIRVFVLPVRSAANCCSQRRGAVKILCVAGDSVNRFCRRHPADSETNLQPTNGVLVFLGLELSQGWAICNIEGGSWGWMR
jgi:hypothetical protein